MDKKLFKKFYIPVLIILLSIFILYLASPNKQNVGDNNYNATIPEPSNTPNKYISMVQQDKKTNNNVNKKKVHHISAQLNEQLMNMLNKRFIDNSIEKFETDVSNLKTNKAKAELTIHYEKINDSYKITKAVGSIRIGTRNYGFKGHGNLNTVIIPGDVETYYVGRIFGELLGIKDNKNEINSIEYDDNNSIWNIIFSLNNENTYLATSIGYEGYTGALVFGNITNSHEFFNLINSNAKSQ